MKIAMASAAMMWLGAQGVPPQPAEPTLQAQVQTLNENVHALKVANYVLLQRIVEIEAKFAQPYVRPPQEVGT